MEHLIDMIENNDYSKLDHGLTRTDLNPKDKQNYKSCATIASDDILSLLLNETETYGTFEKHLPKEALNIYLFNSQSCESMFRNARSLSGTFSTIINFTVADFLHRSQKLSILLGIKCDQLTGQNHSNSLLFPIHHKHKHDAHRVSLQKLDDIDPMDVENIISDAFEQALQLTERLGISETLKKYNLFDMNLLSKYVFRQFSTSSKMFDYSTQITHDEGNNDEFDLEDEEDTEDNNNELINAEQDDDDIFDDQDNADNNLTRNLFFENAFYYFFGLLGTSRYFWTSEV
ncbi:hypothetical protein I4U23_010792 [Adineta vaga]|nr:hypothetical protein I4U23_010792 [Adineta vaga]